MSAISKSSCPICRQDSYNKPDGSKPGRWYGSQILIRIKKSPEEVDALGWFEKLTPGTFEDVAHPECITDSIERIAKGYLNPCTYCTDTNPIPADPKQYTVSHAQRGTYRPVLFAHLSCAEKACGHPIASYETVTTTRSHKHPMPSPQSHCAPGVPDLDVETPSDLGESTRGATQLKEYAKTLTSTSSTPPLYQATEVPEIDSLEEIEVETQHLVNRAIRLAKSARERMELWSSSTDADDVDELVERTYATIYKTRLTENGTELPTIEGTELSTISI